MDDGIAVVGVIWDHGMRAQAIEVWGFMQFWQEGGSYSYKSLNSEPQMLKKPLKP